MFDPMDEETAYEGRVDVERHGGFRTIHIFDFPTRQTHLGGRHRRYLTNFARERHNPRIQWKIVGLASRLGDNTDVGRQLNERLSWERARAVNRHILRENMAAMGRGAGLVEMPELNTRVLGIGSRRSDVEGTTRNDAYHRGVMLFNTSVQLAGINITGRVPFERHDTFRIKYVGSGGGGVGVGGASVAAFAIRDPSNYWQRYLLGSINVGIGAPVSFGDAVPAGEGWVEFRTGRRVKVDDFDGRAIMRETGIQAGSVGVSFLNLEFGYGLGSGNQPIHVECPTGGGFSFGTAESAAAGMATAGDPTHSRGWEHL